MYIKRRERDILEILLKNQGLPISRYDIAQQLGCLRERCIEN
ncbi:HTH domain-containing protein [Staphylococcus pseudintermedius]|nr:HTH domain-containing protein [Staphylococcus pseudintermedius]